jgi:hypothetical protein
MPALRSFPAFVCFGLLGFVSGPADLGPKGLGFHY